MIWPETQSTLQTAVIQAVWHISEVLFAPLAGVFADPWDRKAVMVTTNVAATVVVGVVALEVVNGSGCQHSDPPYFRWPRCVINVMPGLLPILS